MICMTFCTEILSLWLSTVFWSELSQNWYQVLKLFQISFMIVRTLRCLSSRFLHYNQNIVKDWSLMNFTHFWWIKSWWVLVAYLYMLKNVRNLLCILKYLRKQICLPSHIIDYHGEKEKENLNINIWLMKVKMLDAKKWRIQSDVWLAGWQS